MSEASGFAGFIGFTGLGSERDLCDLLHFCEQGIGVELAPTEEVDGQRAGGAYYFVSISESLRYKK